MFSTSLVLLMKSVLSMTKGSSRKIVNSCYDGIQLNLGHTLLECLVYLFWVKYKIAVF